MGIISRFATLMKANINHHINQMNNPEKTISQTLREVTLDLRTVKSELNALESDVNRARRRVDECNSEIRKLKRYTERMQGEDDDKALTFQRKQEELEKKRPEYIAAYNELVIEVRQLQLLQDKLSLDVKELEARSQDIREKTAILNQKQKINEGNSSVSAGFASYEEELQFKMDEAKALEELRTRASTIESIDEEFAKLEERNN